MAYIKDILLENESLKARNEFLERQVNALKLNNQALTRERNELVNKLNNVSIWDLSPKAQEEAGHLLARSLLGTPTSKADIAAEQHEEEIVSAMGSYLGDDY